MHDSLKLNPYYEKHRPLIQISMSSLAVNNSRISRRRELQGLRPSPLKVGKDSCKIKKPLNSHRSPVVIYLKSPEIIHAGPQDFMDLVQRLTGKVSLSSSSLMFSSSPGPKCGSAGATVDDYKAFEAQNNDAKEKALFLAYGLSFSSPLNPL